MGTETTSAVPATVTATNEPYADHSVRPEPDRSRVGRPAHNTTRWAASIRVEDRFESLTIRIFATQLTAERGQDHVDGRLRHLRIERLTPHDGSHEERADEEIGDEGEIDIGAQLAPIHCALKCAPN
jgi:hypothetical protein